MYVCYKAYKLLRSLDKCSNCIKGAHLRNSGRRNNTIEVRAVAPYSAGPGPLHQSLGTHKITQIYTCTYSLFHQAHDSLMMRLRPSFLQHLLQLVQPRPDVTFKKLIHMIHAKSSLGQNMHPQTSAFLCRFHCQTVGVNIIGRFQHQLQCFTSASCDKNW